MKNVGDRERTICNALLMDTYGIKFKMIMKATENSQQKKLPTISNLCEAVARRQDARIKMSMSISHVRGTGYFTNDRYAVLCTPHVTSHKMSALGWLACVGLVIVREQPWSSG